MSGCLGGGRKSYDVTRASRRGVQPVLIGRTSRPDPGLVDLSRSTEMVTVDALVGDDMEIRPAVAASMQIPHSLHPTLAMGGRKRTQESGVNVMLE